MHRFSPFLVVNPASVVLLLISVALGLRSCLLALLLLPAVFQSPNHHSLNH
jgi:hypothetical protein